MAAKKGKKAKRDESVPHTFVLLDRSGSMMSRWKETISSVNHFADTLSKTQSKSLLTLAVFDKVEKTQFDVIRDSVPVSEWKPMKEDEVTPRGWTPLLDAAMRMVTLSRSKSPKKAAIVIMTDGAENSSTEVKKADVQAALDHVRKLGWQVIFLGVDFDAFSEAGGLGIRAGLTLNTSVWNLPVGTSVTAGRLSTFYDTGAPVKFTAKDRKKVDGGK